MNRPLRLPPERRHESDEAYRMCKPVQRGRTNGVGRGERSRKGGRPGADGSDDADGRGTVRPFEPRGAGRDEPEHRRMARSQTDRRRRLRADNKKIGTITDILIGHDGAARSVVIGVGDSWAWVPRMSPCLSAPFNGEPRAAMYRPSRPRPSRTPQRATAKPQTRKIDPAAEEASQGYPDKAMLNMTVAQLKAAPDFKYAPDPAAQTESASQGLEQRSHAQTSVPKP